VLENVGYPLVFPTLSIGDSLMRPSGMLFRNLMTMELEALLRANPIDAVVLLTGCDNTAPAYIMGARSPGARKRRSGQCGARRKH
jgi:L-arabonate dehydrase